MAGKASFNEARLKPVFEDWENLISNDFFHPKGLKAKTHQILVYLYRGEAAMTFNGNFITKHMGPDYRDDFGFFGFPTINDSQKRYEEAPTDVLFINNHSKHIKEAETFLQFMARPEILSLYNDTIGYISPNRNSARSQNAFISTGADWLQSSDGNTLFFDRDTIKDFAAPAFKALADLCVNPTNRLLSQSSRQHGYWFFQGHTMNNNQVSAGYLLGILSVLFTPSTFASSVFLGHTSTQRLVTVGDTLQELSPAGTDLFLSYDINDSWSISADYSKLDDDDTINNVLNLTYEFDSKGLGLSYFGDDWSVNYQFSDFEEQQDTLSNRPDGNGAVRHNQGSAHSLSASYFLSLNENWQVSTSVGIHYNDWDESNTQILISPPNSDEPGNTMPMATEESGDASLISIAANLNRYTMLNENTGMTLGIFVGWNEVLDSQSELQSINNRNINAATRGGNRGGTIDNFLISGGESYGIASMYLSIDFFDNWVVDLDFNTDFGTDDSIHTWSLGLGYLF